MEIVLDGKPLDGELTGANLQEMLGDLSQRWMADDRTLREVLINGRPYQEKLDGPADHLPREQVERLEVETIDARELALAFMGQGEAFVSPMAAAVEHIAELFRVSDEKEANEQYLQLLENLQLFLQALGQCQQVLQLDLNRAIEGAATAAEHTERLASLVGDLLAAQEEQDWILLADVLEYDLLPELQAWQRLMPQLREQAGS